MGAAPLIIGRRVQLATLAVHYELPAIYGARENVEAGGLVSYGTNLTDQVRQVGIYTGRILKGEKAADLPVVRAASICRQRGSSALKCRRRCSPLPTR